VVEPAAIATELAEALIAPVVAIVTVAPPVPTGAPRVTVHVAAVPGFNEAGLHASEVTVTEGGITFTVPPVALTGTALPSGAAARAPLTPISIAAEPEIVADTVATTPSAIAVAFMPLAMQLYPPDPAAHVNVLPAAVAAAPAATERLETPAGYAKVHWTADAVVPLGDESERSNETAPPATTLLDERVRDD
jgi:hypothetical protein